MAIPPTPGMDVEEGGGAEEDGEEEEDEGRTAEGLDARMRPRK